MEKVKKRQKNGMAYKIFSIFLSVALIVLTIGMIVQLFQLDVLPSHIAISLSILLFLVSILFIVLLTFVCRKIWSKIFIVFLVLILSVFFGFGNLYLYQTSVTLDSITDTNEGKIKNTVSVISLQDGISNVEKLKNKKVGTLRSIDTTGTKKSIADLKKNDILIQTKNYDNLNAIVKALYDREVDAIILNEVYRQNILELDGRELFTNESQVLHQTVFYTEDTNEALVVDNITQNPFTILVSGNDTYGEIDELSRSDVNMLVTVNPVTSTVLMVNIPRDYYVETSIGMDKLTHTGMYGVEETKEAIENLLDIEINYTFRVNFSSAEEIVDALDGVDIFVEEGMAVERLNADWSLPGVEEGWNHLDGKRALAYARERHAYVDGDIQRAKNQQQVLEAIINKAASSKILTNYTKLLDSFKGAFDTNMSTKEITTLLKYELQAMPKWKFQNYVLRGIPDMASCASSNIALSVVFQDDYCVEIAREKIQAVLDGNSADDIVDEYDVGQGGIAEGYIEQENMEAYYSGQ